MICATAWHAFHRTFIAVPEEEEEAAGADAADADGTDEAAACCCCCCCCADPADGDARAAGGTVGDAAEAGAEDGD